MRRTNIFIKLIAGIICSCCLLTGCKQKKSTKPELTKLPFAFSDVGRTPMENTPFYFNSKLLIVANHRPGGSEAKGEDAYLYIDNLQTGQEVASCAMGIFENKMGGRICVAGYYPWTFMENLSKSTQMKTVFRWLSKDNLPGYIDSFHKINLWIREPNDGKIALAFTNSSFDPAENVVLKLKTANKTIRVFDMDCKETVIQASETDGPYQKFVIPKVDAWQMRLVLSDV